MTLKQLVQEIRDLTHEPLKVDPSQPPVTVKGAPIRVYLSELADKIDELASMRDNEIHSNNAKMREALEKIAKIVWDKRRHTKEETEAFRIATEVLTEVHITSPEPIGNAAKMREAVLSIRGIVSSYGHKFIRTHILRLCNSALAAPPRNCDVGTPREQELRMDEWCRNGNRHCRCGDDGCPIYNIKNNCVFDWLQLPYEGGETK